VGTFQWGKQLTIWGRGQGSGNRVNNWGQPLTLDKKEEKSTDHRKRDNHEGHEEGMHEEHEEKRTDHPDHERYKN